MKQVPVSSSILSATHLNYFLQERYVFIKNSTCRLIKAGINHTYLITGNAEKYVFRVYSLNWRTEKEVLEELRLINHLKNNNISVSYPLPDQDDNYIQVLHAPEGSRYGVLFSYASGEKLFNFPAATHFGIGEMMALIHRNTSNFTLERVNYTPQTLLMLPFQELKQFVSADTAEMNFMTSTLKYLLKEFNKVNPKYIRQGAVHLDIWFDNLNVDTENRITLFDFDFCGNGWLCLDISYYLLQLHVVETDHKEYSLKAEHFLKGYETVTKISSEERRILPMLGTSLYFFYLGVQCQRFENWSNVFINEVYLKRYINFRVKTQYDFYNMPA